MYKLFLALRYLRERAIAFVAVAAVMLCVAMVLVVRSIMGGWLEKVQENARGLLGDLVVDNRSYSGFPLYDEFIAQISTWPEIDTATPVIYTAGLYRYSFVLPDGQERNRNGTVRIAGVRLAEAVRVNALGRGLFYERFYPGTTTLDPQRQPLLGPDSEAPPLQSQGDVVWPAPRLPEPFHSALAHARAEASAAGRELTDTESTPSSLNQLLAEFGRPELPGVFELGAGDAPELAGEPRPGIILGRDLFCDRESDGRYARPEYLPRGHPVLLTIWASSLRGNVDPIPKKEVFRYADDMRTGVYNIDAEAVYVDFDLLQRLLEWDRGERADGTGTFRPRCSQIQIKVRPEVTPELLPALCQRLEERYRALAYEAELPPDEAGLLTFIDALTWQESQAHIIGPVQKERMLVTILFGVISLVAVALVLCILYMIVLQKTRDIGIVKSLGGSSTGVAAIFVLYGAVVGLIGAGLGLALGSTFVANINRVQDYLITLNPAWRVWDLKVYSFDTIPESVDPWDALVIVLFAIVASTCGSVAAAWRAGIMHPVEALRHE